MNRTEFNNIRENIRETLKEFRINEFLILRLEKDNLNPYPHTVIYIKNKPFYQCKSALLNIPADKINSFDEIESIDEAIEKFNSTFEEKMQTIKIKLPPEAEFWAHCSNLQVWYEHFYDARLLHHNLAFPLLNILAKSGDLQAKKVFPEEIAKRFESGYIPVISYLFIEKFLDYLPDDYLHDLAQYNISFCIKILFDSISSKIILGSYLASLYLFNRLYPYLSQDIIAKFINIVKKDKNKVLNILYKPGMLTPASWIYINPRKLYNVRLALILNMLRNQDYYEYDLNDVELYNYLEEELNYNDLKNEGALARKKAHDDWEKLKREFKNL
jgi:hypothetical protein